MPRLSHRHWKRLLDGVGRLNSLHDLDTVVRHVLQVGRDVVPADTAAWDAVHVRKQHHCWATDPPGVMNDGPAEAHAAFFKEHPLLLHFQRTGDLPPLRISDFLSRRQFRETGLYRLAYRGFGVEYQLGFTLPGPSPGWCVGVMFHRRERDFSDEERFMFELLRPHVLRACHNAAIVTASLNGGGLDTPATSEAPQALVALDARGHIRSSPPHVSRWFDAYFGETPGPGELLPEELRAWSTAHQLASTNAGALPPPSEPLVIERDGRRLTARLLASGEDGRLLALEQRPTTWSADGLRPLGLTTRQAEILLWIAQGKTSREIGTILGVSHQTVRKHTEHILAKLGVETRTAAAARAWEAMNGHGLAEG